MKSFALQGYENPTDSWTQLVAIRETETDYCSRDGAVALKAKIESYWRDRGQDVMLSLHNEGFHPAIRAARYDVRSDMVNGMPRSGLKAPSAARDTYTVSLVETEADDIGDSVWIDD